jgi:hypothetical protein
MENSEFHFHAGTMKQGDYTIKEITEYSNLTRRVFDRYKKRFPSYFKASLKRVNEKGASCYEPIIMDMAYSIKEMKKLNKNSDEIDLHLLNRYNLQNAKGTKSKNQKINSKDPYKNLLDTGKDKISAKSKNISATGENLGENRILEKKVFELELALKDKEIALKDKDILIAEKKGQINTLSATVDGLEKRVLLLIPPENPKNLEINFSFIYYFFIPLIIIGGFIVIWIYLNA